MALGTSTCIAEPGRREIFSNIHTHIAQGRRTVKKSGNTQRNLHIQHATTQFRARTIEILAVDKSNNAERHMAQDSASRSPKLHRHGSTEN